MQSDFYRNPSSNTKKPFPYIVGVQSPFISELATQIVIPLGNKRSFKNESLKGLTPEIEYDGEQFLLLTPQIASIPANILNKPVGSLSHLRSEIISAIDFAITGV